MSKQRCDSLGRRIPTKDKAKCLWRCECPMPNCVHWSADEHLDDAITSLLLHILTHGFKIKRDAE